MTKPESRHNGEERIGEQKRGEGMQGTGGIGSGYFRIAGGFLSMGSNALFMSFT